ncbi:HAD family hydrolase [Inquilinus sp. CAU 1745]|uniref:HAD family hydrolase n=1 Tax=Inquilinus sp. CAU 1745 TaxID=3140369 RepID=UPI00325BBF95
MIKTIAFDGDDTLWHNERIFSMTQEKFRALIRSYVPEGEIDDRLQRTEIENLRIFGYGIKGFTLSMVETAIALTDGRITARDIQAIIGFGREMLEHPVELLDDVRETVEALKDRYRLIIITKGDLFDQESKVARSGLADLFWRVEIVSEKDAATYGSILKRHDIAPSEFLMIGNSVRSDVLPVLEIGARAVHLPYELTWVHEVVTPSAAGDGFPVLERMADFPALVARLDQLAPAS